MSDSDVFDSWLGGASLFDVDHSFKSIHDRRRHSALRLRFHLQSKLPGQVFYSNSNSNVFSEMFETRMT